VPDSPVADGWDRDAGSDAAQPKDEVRFNETYPLEQRVALKDWLAQRGVAQAPVESDCWALEGLPETSLTSLMCVRTQGEDPRTRRLATLYVVDDDELHEAWSATVGAGDGRLELTPVFKYGNLLLEERTEGACARAVEQAAEEVTSGGHNRAFVELVRSACSQMGLYAWIENRFRFVGPRRPPTVSFPCERPPPPLDHEKEDDGVRDDVHALRKANPGRDSSQIEEQYVEVRVRVALEAFARRDRAGIRRWMAQGGTRREERAFGAFLLRRLGVRKAREHFVAHFPERASRSFHRLLDLEYALWSTGADEPICGAKRRPCFVPQFTLACAAIAGWKGAARKLLLTGDLTDAGSASDNHWLLAEVTAARPDQMLRLAVGLCRPNVLIHAFLAEATPTAAARAHRKLRWKRYRDPQVEQLRAVLLPILLPIAVLPPGSWGWIKEPLDCSKYL